MHDVFKSCFLVTATSDLAVIFTMFIAFHALVFCRKIHSTYTKLLSIILILVGLLYEVQNYIWYVNQSIFTREDIIGTYMEGALASLALIFFIQIHKLEMKRRASLLSEKKTRYMMNEYTKTSIFGTDFLGLSWDYASVKNFMKTKIIIAEVLAYALLLSSIVGSLITRMGG